MVDVHILFVRLHTSKPALPTGPVGTSASDFIPLRPHDYQLSIQLIGHSDGSWTRIVLLDDLSNPTDPESKLHHAFDTNLRSSTIADPSATRLSKCLGILNLHVGQVTSEWEGVYSQLSQAISQLVSSSPILLMRSETLFLEFLPHYSSMLVLSLDSTTDPKSLFSCCETIRLMGVGATFCLLRNKPWKPED